MALLLGVNCKLVKGGRLLVSIISAHLSAIRYQVGLCVPRSVDARGEEEVLDQRHNPNLAEVQEELIKFLLVGAVQDEVGAEDEDGSREDGKNLQGFEPNYPVKEQINLVDLQDGNEGEVHPWECCLQRLYAELVHMVANLWLVHLKQVLEELA